MQCFNHKPRLRFNRILSPFKSSHHSDSCEVESLEIHLPDFTTGPTPINSSLSHYPKITSPRSYPKIPPFLNPPSKPPRYPQSKSPYPHQPPPHPSHPPTPSPQPPLHSTHKSPPSYSPLLNSRSRFDTPRLWDICRCRSY